MYGRLSGGNLAMHTRFSRRERSDKQRQNELGFSTLDIGRSTSIQDREQVILSHAKMCHEVASSLMPSRSAARNLTREVLVWAWHLDDEEIFARDFRARLLAELVVILTTKHLGNRVKAGMRGRVTYGHAGRNTRAVTP
jgi:hypothetical protein